MKTPRQTANYVNEKSCIEDVLSMANEILQANQPATGLDSRVRVASPQRAEKQTRFH